MAIPFERDFSGDWFINRNSDSLFSFFYIMRRDVNPCIGAFQL